jgi:hypothetical protein
LQELAQEIDDADAKHDLARKQALAYELEMLQQHVLAGARARHRPTERARKAVYNRIHQAIEHIESSHRELARHLVRTIKTGAHCEYRSEDERAWETAAHPA